MAATAAYVDVCRINKGGGQPGDKHRETNISATGSAFALKGGTYGVTVHAAFPGSVTLQVLAADGLTWLTAMTAFSADGVAVADLPPGSYRVALA